MDNKTNKLVMTALMMALTIVATLFVRVPIPFTQGYVHIGDTMVFMSALVLGRKYGVAAAGVGAALADVIGAFAAWAPWTFVIKSAMVLILGTVADNIDKKKDKQSPIAARVELVMGMIAAGAVMTVGYWVAEGVMYGNYVTAALGIPWNIGQFAVGMVLAMVLQEVLCKTQLKTVFTYHI